MKTVNTIKKIKSELNAPRLKNQSIGFIPTMGNLHEGHISLINKSKSQNEITICSIFVNPLQFGKKEDFKTYPRTLNEDIEKLEASGCDFVFIPNLKEIYSSGFDNQIKITVPESLNILEGTARPGHFSGMATIVNKLFNIVTPDYAYFGLKDYQQYLIVKRLVKDLNINIKIVGLKTARNSSGLALSSRNNYLDNDGKNIASNIYKTLTKTKNEILSGVNDYAKLERCAVKFLEKKFKVDYFTIRNDTTLKKPNVTDKSLVILTACYLDKVRLIDNIQIKLK